MMLIDETIDTLVNFGINERTIPYKDAPGGVPIFGKSEDLDGDFVTDFDAFVQLLGWQRTKHAAQDLHRQRP